MRFYGNLVWWLFDDAVLETKLSANVAVKNAQPPGGFCVLEWAILSLSLFHRQLGRPSSTTAHSIAIDYFSIIRGDLRICINSIAENKWLA